MSKAAMRPNHVRATDFPESTYVVPTQWSDNSFICRLMDSEDPLLANEVI